MLELLAVKIPAVYGIYEVTIFAFLIGVFSIYRTKVFSAIKEFFYDLVFAGIFTGGVIAILQLRNPNTIAYLFAISLVVIFASRILYHYTNKPMSYGGARKLPGIP